MYYSIVNLSLMGMKGYVIPYYCASCSQRLLRKKKHKKASEDTVIVKWDIYIQSKHTFCPWNICHLSKSFVLNCTEKPFNFWGRCLFCLSTPFSLAFLELNMFGLLNMRLFFAHIVQMFWGLNEWMKFLHADCMKSHSVSLAAWLNNLHNCYNAACNFIS